MAEQQRPSQSPIRGGMPGCSICGLNWVPAETLLTLVTATRAYWCKDQAGCAERWLLKYLSGRPLRVDAVTAIGSGPRQQAVFEIAYHVNGQAEVKKRVVMPELHAGEDLHRRSEHYHLFEFGKDITDSFGP
ncbi:MAG: hypothetical protein EXR67_03595 [Dehalococcoidia bacterium]|nr:hypothetical protein [Dehalococcoidia bacterium]